MNCPNIIASLLAAASALSICSLGTAVAADAPSAPVVLHWLDQSAPAVPQGVSWGIPWPQGAVNKQTTFALTDGGAALAVQSWPLAYWPDGSVKWTGFAATAQPDLGTTLAIQPDAKPAAPQNPLQIQQSDQFIDISNGNTSWRIARHGQNLIESISLNNRVIATDGRLICQRQDRSDWQTQHALRTQDFTSQIDSVDLEQSGPVRAVVKIQGKHKSDSGGRTWLPFIVRLYFFSGTDTVRMVHTFIFDGDQETDFISALGVRFTVPLREEFHNRHVRLAGDQGFFAEPVQLIAGRRDRSPDLYAKQIAGQRIPNLDQLPDADNVKQMAVWDAYKLVQSGPDGFAISKRTNPDSAWISAAGGSRSLGLAFVGDVSGGLAVDMNNFWQLCPTELEIQGASGAAASLTVWLWSPDVPPMDMRHYDTKPHGLEASYEDVQSGFSNATGVARTCVLNFRPFNAVPTDAELLNQANADQHNALLVCSPQYYHSIPTFGLWSLPDRSTPQRIWMEDRLDKAFDFYRGQVDQRRWYGFWDFGDFMHTYDTPRHEWRYDVGGFAWDNTELIPNLWLWYAFLRTGRADVFRMAENLTRQSQEVDVYHLGPWKGLGSRHNVRHWGDGAKEVRISQALLKRPYYYLTTDERTGDLMNEVIDADQALLKADPLRELPGISDEHKYPTHLRIGPDWFALAGNWFTAWERTGDTKYRDKILVGMNCITALPDKIMSSDNFGYDPASGKIYLLKSGPGAPSLLGLFGGPELNSEMNPIINDPAWTAAWDEFCKTNNLRGPDNARLTAYAAYVAKDPAEAARAWRQFLQPGRFGPGVSFDSHKVSGPAVPEVVDEIPNVSTNSTSQWCLNAIELLQMIGDQLAPNRPADDRPAAQTRP
jgi:hypothetical protein